MRASGTVPEVRLEALRLFGSKFPECHNSLHEVLVQVLKNACCQEFGKTSCALPQGFPIFIPLDCRPVGESDGAHHVE